MKYSYKIDRKLFFNTLAITKFYKRNVQIDELREGEVENVTVYKHSTLRYSLIYVSNSKEMFVWNNIPYSFDDLPDFLLSTYIVDQDWYNYFNTKLSLHLYNMIDNAIKESK